MGVNGIEDFSERVTLHACDDDLSFQVESFAEEYLEKWAKHSYGIIPADM